MKHIIILFLVLASSATCLSQNLSEYKDIIRIDDKIEEFESNLTELDSLDISNFWINNVSKRRFGFIGSNYQRLQIVFLSIIKNNEKHNQYLIYGKSKVSENICSFQGVIEIKESGYIVTSDNPSGNTGILTGEYTFYENPKDKHTGVFKGRFTTYWYKDKNGIIKYNDLWDVSAMYNNNQFAGNWTEYGKSNKLTANWGDSRIPQSKGFDVGTSEFRPSDKYAKNGWVVFLIANGASPDRMNIEAARKTENKMWWKK